MGVHTVGLAECSIYSFMTSSRSLACPPPVPSTPWKRQADSFILNQAAGARENIQHKAGNIPEIDGERKRQVTVGEIDGESKRAFTSSTLHACIEKYRSLSLLPFLELRSVNEACFLLPCFLSLSSLSDYSGKSATCLYTASAFLQPVRHNILFQDHAH